MRTYCKTSLSIILTGVKALNFLDKILRGPQNDIDKIGFGNVLALLVNGQELCITKQPTGLFDILPTERSAKQPQPKDSDMSIEGIDRDYAAVLAAALEKWFWGPLGPSKISPTVLFSKPISFSGGKIRRNLNFFQISGIPTPRRPDANWLVSL